jgi:DNA-binding transcriptional MerR regulator
MMLDVYVNVNQATTMDAATKERIWSVRELADELGVTTRTLRFYEAEGLLSPRRVGTARIYTARDHTRLVLILRGKRFGMSLPEIREIVDMYDDAASGERGQLGALIARLAEIAADLRARRRDLSRTLAEVDDVTDRCRRRLAELPQ